MKRRIVFGLVASVTLAVTLGISSVLTTSGSIGSTAVTQSENVGIVVPSGTGASMTYLKEGFPNPSGGNADTSLQLEVMDTFGEGAVADVGYDVLAHQLQQAKLRVMETFGEGAVADIGYEVLMPRIDREKGMNHSITYWSDSLPNPSVDDADTTLQLEVMDTFGEGAVADFGYDVLAHQLQQAKLEVMETFGEGAVADIGYEVLMPRVDREKGMNHSITYWSDSIPNPSVGDTDTSLQLEVMDTFGEGAVSDVGHDVLVHRLQQLKLEAIDTFGEGAVADIGFEVLVRRTR